MAFAKDRLRKGIVMNSNVSVNSLGEVNDAAKIILQILKDIGAPADTRCKVLREIYIPAGVEIPTDLKEFNKIIKRNPPNPSIPSHLSISSSEKTIVP